MIGRIAGMNSAAIFISLLFLGLVVGVWGMLLSVPIIVIAKVVSEHVEELHPLRNCSEMVAMEFGVPTLIFQADAFAKDWNRFASR
jgi:hypothetical protein